MKKLLIILLTVLSCVAVKAQKPVQTIGVKTNIVKVLGELGVDSAILFPKDTIQLTSSDRAVAIKGTTPYLWNGTKWGLIIVGKDTLLVDYPLYVDTTEVPGYRVLKIHQQDGLISGGIVTWSGVGLVFNVSAATYIIGGRFYGSPATQVTLDPADATFPRIDLFVVDTAGHALKVTGTPAAIPLAPQPIIGVQLALTLGTRINVGDTIPSGITLSPIYNENTGYPSEFNTQNSLSTVDFNNTANPYRGTKDAYVSSYNSGGQLRFVNYTGSVYVHNLVQPNNVLTIPIYSNGKFNNKIYAKFYDSSISASNDLLITSPTYNFNPNDSNQYQVITVPFSAFSWSRTTFSTLALEFVGSDTTGAKGFYVDYVNLQNGITQAPVPNDYSNKADSAGTYKINDSTYVTKYFVKGIGYVIGDTIHIKSTGGSGGGTGTVTNVTATNNYAETWTIGTPTTAPNLSLVLDTSKLSTRAYNAATYQPIGSYLTSIDTTNIPSFSVKVRSLFGANAPITYNSATGKFGADTSTAITGLATQYDVSLKGRVDSIRFANSGLLHTSPAAFALSGNTAVITQTLANHAPYTLLGNNTGSTTTPTFFTNPYSDSLRRIGVNVSRRVNGVWINQYTDSTGGAGGSGTDSSAYHTVSIYQDTLLILHDLRGRADTVSMQNVNLFGRNSLGNIYRNSFIGVFNINPTAALEITSSSNASPPDSSKGIFLTDTIPATSGTPNQYPGGLWFKGKVWNGSASATTESEIWMQPGTLSPTLFFDVYSNTGAKTSAMTLSSSQVTVPGQITANTTTMYQNGITFGGTTATIKTTSSNFGSPTLSYGGNLTQNVNSTFNISTYHYFDGNIAPTVAAPGIDVFMGLNPTENWKTGSTGSYEGLRIAPIETSLPSSSSYLLRAGVQATNFNGLFNVTNKGEVGVGDTTNYQTSALSIKTDLPKGFLGPRLTTLSRDSIIGTWTASITAGGTSYSFATPTAITALTGGSGRGATAVFTRTSGAVATVTMVNYGTGYKATDVLSATLAGGSGFTYTISAVNAPPTGLTIYNTDMKRYNTYNGTSWDYSPIVSKGTAAPTTTPLAVGDDFLDTTNKKAYKAMGTASSSDWVILN